MPAFDWHGYLDLSRQLHSLPNPASREAVLRSIISRAFYAAFILARNNARDNHKQVMDGSTRDYNTVFMYYKKSNPRITPDLKNLKAWRENCDYSDIVDNLEIIAKEAIRISQMIISKLPEYHIPAPY